MGALPWQRPWAEARRSVPALVLTHGQQRAAELGQEGMQCDVGGALELQWGAGHPGHGVGPEG